MCLGFVLKVLLRGWYPAWNTSAPFLLLEWLSFIWHGISNSNPILRSFYEKSKFTGYLFTCMDSFDLNSRIDLDTSVHSTRVLSTNSSDHIVSLKSLETSCNNFINCQVLKQIENVIVWYCVLLCINLNGSQLVKLKSIPLMLLPWNSQGRRSWSKKFQLFSKNYNSCDVKFWSISWKIDILCIAENS